MSCHFVAAWKSIKIQICILALIHNSVADDDDDDGVRVPSPATTIPPDVAILNDDSLIEMTKSDHPIEMTKSDTHGESKKNVR